MHDKQSIGRFPVVVCTGGVMDECVNKAEEVAKLGIVGWW